MRSLNNLKKPSILYLGTIIPNDSIVNSFKGDKFPQIATHLFSLKLFQAIISYTNSDLYVFSTRPISDFPKSNSIINVKKKWIISNYLISEFFFINFPVIKSIILTFGAFYRSILWGVNLSSKRNAVVFIDNYQLPYLIVGFLIKLIFNIPNICVITDPPNMTYKLASDPIVKKMFRGLNGSITKFLFNRLDGAICLTESISNDFCPQSLSLIVEAIGQGNSNFKSTFGKNFKIVYAGGLSTKYGIESLLNAFILLPYEEMELYFFGKGDAVSLIQYFSSFDSRIKYGGFVNNEEILKIQANASLLINPRPTNLPDGHYSFPSKILEYLESGTPSLVTKLAGIPKDYYNFLFFMDEKNIGESIEKVYNIYKNDLDFYVNFGEEAKKFADSRGIFNQGIRINNFIDEVKRKFYV